MTQKRILELAYGRALDIWALANKRVEESPRSSILKDKEQKAHNEVMEISRLLWEEEHK